MSDEGKVECEVHGEASATFICHHLADGIRQGFNMGFDPDDPDARYPDAWCDKCEEVYQQAGEWNDTSEGFADIRMVCSGCYQEIRERNWIQDDEEFEQYLSSSFEYLQKMQDKFIEDYRIGSYEHWDWDQESGKLIFSDEGRAVLELDIDFVGTLSTATNTWMWAWANQSLTENIRATSREIRDIGDERQFLKLACAHWIADESDGWAMTAIMAKDTGAMGAYRTPSDNGFVYMTVNKARWLDEKNANNVIRLTGR